MLEPFKPEIVEIVEIGEMGVGNDSAELLPIGIGHMRARAKQQPNNPNQVGKP